MVRSCGLVWDFELLFQMARLPHLPFTAHAIAPKLECEPQKAWVRSHAFVSSVPNTVFNKYLLLKIT